MARVIVHIDLNAFFVRAEEIKNPSLENKAVAIGHNGRGGIVSTCSYEARNYGVHSAMPMNQAVKLCPHLIIIPGDYHFYSALSEEFKSYIKSFTPLVEEASIDEVYADFTDQIKGIKDVEGYFRSIQEGLYKKTGLKCSIGVGPTKFIAKMGSDYQKPMGLTIIRRRDIAKILYPLDIADMFGIGKKSAPRLKEIGIKTIGDLASALNNNDPKVYQLLGKFCEELKLWVNGYGEDKIITEFDDPKSIGNSMTLKEDTSNYEVIRNAFEYIARSVSLRAKKENKLGMTIQIMVKDTLYHAHNKSITLSKAINSEQDILLEAMRLYERNYLSLTIRALGITLQNLVDPRNSPIQMTLFDYQKHEEENATKLLINKLNREIEGANLIRASEVNKKDGTH